MIGFVCANAPREERMRRSLVFPGAAVVMLVAAAVAAADNKPKGPKEDGTMPSLAKEC